LRDEDADSLGNSSGKLLEAATSDQYGGMRRASSWMNLRLRIQRKGGIRIRTRSKGERNKEEPGLSLVVSGEKNNVIAVTGGTTATRPTSTI
jgi:hypothetical protein